MNTEKTPDQLRIEELSNRVSGNPAFNALNDEEQAELDELRARQPKESLEPIAPETFLEDLDEDKSPSVESMFGTEIETGDDGVEYEDAEQEDLPLFDFADPVTITLKDGTACKFRVPTLESEQRADDLRKTTTTTSSVKINGQSPVQEHTEHFKADIRYFLDNADEISGFPFETGDEAGTFKARDVVRVEQQGEKREVKITYAHLVPTRHKRAFVARLYGGKVEVVKQKDADKRVPALNAQRQVTIRQELGVEQNDDGTMSKPTHIIEYTFREPNSPELSLWQQCWNGFKLPLKGGGSKSESSFKTASVGSLFDKLISGITGAAYKREAFNMSAAHVAGVPPGVKRTMAVMAMAEFTRDVGND